MPTKPTHFVFLIQREHDTFPWATVFDDLELAEGYPHRISPVVPVVLERSPARSPTVAAYFQARFGEELEPVGELPIHPNSPHHPDFTLMTGCGADCKVAIDKTAELLDLGDISHEDRRRIIDVCRGIVRVYVYG